MQQHAIEVYAVQFVKDGRIRWGNQSLDEGIAREAVKCLRSRGHEAWARRFRLTVDYRDGVETLHFATDDAEQPTKAIPFVPSVLPSRLIGAAT